MSPQASHNDPYAPRNIIGTITAAIKRSAILDRWLVSLSLLAFGVGIAQIQLQVSVNTNYGYGTQNLFILQGNTTIEPVWAGQILPEHLWSSVNSLLVSVGALSIATGLVCFTYVGSARADTQNGPVFTLASAFLSSASIVAIPVAIVYTFCREYGSSKFAENDLSSGVDVRISPGDYTRESWACQIHAFDPVADSSGYLRHVCQEAKPSRWMLFPLLLIMGALAVTSLMDGFHRFGLKSAHSETVAEAADDEKASQ